MGNELVIRGAGGSSKGGGQQRTPIESPDSLISTAYAKVIDIISEGECYGFADQVNPLSSYILNETRVANPDGTLNFQNIQVDSRTGTQVQDYMRGFDGVENEIGINVELNGITAWTRSITNLNLSAVRVTLSTPQMTHTDVSNGDTKGTVVYYTIELATDGGSFVMKLESAFRGKTTSRYQRSHRIDLPPAEEGWTLRVRRLTADSASSTLQNQTYVDSFAEIIDAKMRMPMTAVVGVIVAADQFNSIPTRAHHWKGRIVKVPSNYDAETREYDGIWDGTFQSAYTNNPAWVFYDMVTNTRYGLGHLITPDLIDKWNLYRISQYCDELVDDGFGGQEPRFTCNMYLQVQGDALRVMQDIASVFRGVLFAAAGSIFAEADMPDDPVYLYNQTNVTDGKFSYSGSGKKARHTVALVSWNDMNDMCRAKIEYVDDKDGIARYGIQPTEVIATGCTSRGQAHRLGRYILATERYETDIVTFGVGLDGAIPAPGKIIVVADPLRAGRRTGGRVRSATLLTVTVDKIPLVTPGDTVTCITPNGVPQKRTVGEVHLPSATIHVTEEFDAIPTTESVWLVEAPDLAAQRFRVLGVSENNSNNQIGYVVTGIRHVEGKYAYVEEGVMIEEPPTVGARNVPPAPEIVLTSFERYGHGTAFHVMNADWENLIDATSYEIQWQKDNGPWSASRRKGESNDEWEGAFAGTYRCRAWGINHFGIPGAMGLSNDVTVGDATMPIIDVEPVAGVVTIDCRYTQFRLNLNQNVTSVVFTNVAPQDTLLIEVTQAAPGSHTLDFGPSVYPVSGTPYVPSTSIGSVDLLGLTTQNSGTTWALVAQKPGESVAGPLSITLSPNPAEDTVDTDGITGTAPSVTITTTVNSGTLPVTHSWTRADTAGGTDFLIDDATSATPTITIASGVTAYGPVTQTWRNSATDDDGQTQAKTVVITLERNAPESYGTDWQGDSFTTTGAAMSGPTGGKTKITFYRDGTWIAHGTRIQGGVNMPTTVKGSGVWLVEGGIEGGDDYEILFTPTGSGGTITSSTNATTSHQPLSDSKWLQLQYTTMEVDGFATRDINISIRKIADVDDDVTGTVTLRAEGFNG